MKICVFCSSSERIDEKFLRAGRSFGEELGRRGHELIYGGYGRGLMGEVARGTHETGGTVTAVVPAIFDDERFIYSGCSRVADALAVLPGGVGTYDELFDTLALISLGELVKPLSVLDVDGFFAPLKALLDDGAAKGFIAEKTAASLMFFAAPGELLDAVEHGEKLDNW